MMSRFEFGIIKKKKYKFLNLHGDPITKNKLILHGIETENLEVFWDQTNKFTCKFKNKYITFNKIWFPSGVNWVPL